MQQIQTGYVPDGALGAMYAGWNAANAEDENTQNLAKLFLANQREQQMLPLDVQIRQGQVAPQQYESQLAQAKMTDPDYIKSVLSGYKGQMNSQIAAGDKAKALLPFAVAAEKAQLENDKAKQDFQWTINDLTDKLMQGGATDENGNVVPASPSQLAFFKNKRDQLNQLLAEDPQYIQKDMLKDQQYQTQLELQAMKAQQALELQSEKDRAKEASKQTKYNEILMQQMQILANPNSSPEEKAIAQQIVNLHRMNKLYSNPAAWQEGIDLSKLGNIPMKPSVIEQAGGNAPKVTDEDLIKKYLQ